MGSLFEEFHVQEHLDVRRRGLGVWEAHRNFLSLDQRRAHVGFQHARVLKKFALPAAPARDHKQPRITHRQLGNDDRVKQAD